MAALNIAHHIRSDGCGHFFLTARVPGSPAVFAQQEQGTSRGDCRNDAYDEDALDQDPSRKMVTRVSPGWAFEG
jgi:hypothetical protein